MFAAGVLIALGNVEEGDALVRRALNSGKAALMKLRLNSHN